MKVEDLKKYKNSLYSSKSRDLASFERYFILICIGMLVFPMTLMNNVIKITEAEYLSLLAIGYCFVLLATFTIMYSFISSANGSDKLWKIVDNFIDYNMLYDNDSDLLDSQVKHIKTQTNSELCITKRRLKNMRHVAVLCLFTGITQFVVFVFFNLN